MRSIQYIFYLFHRLYVKAPHSMPHFDALVLMAGLVTLNVFEIMLATHRFSWVILGIPPLLILTIVPIFIRPRHIREISFDEHKVRNGVRWLIAYIIFSVIMIIVTLTPYLHSSEPTKIRPRAGLLHSTNGKPYCTPQSKSYGKAG